jgi:hypothetical protein
MTRIDASEVNFIKLGSGGEWEKECLREGTILFGYRETPHELCVSGDWEGVWTIWNEIRGDGGTATRDTKQIRTFYESDEQSIFITFAGGVLHWCRPVGEVEVLSDGGRRRQTVDGWHSTTVGGTPLTTDRLSGDLLKVQMFRGTICQVKAAQYLLRKLNDELSPEVAAAEEAEHALINAITGLMRLLTWQDFELLVDLIFSSSGWRRVSVVGRTQKTLDLELLLPTTGERAFVQIKSFANPSDLREYIERFNGMTVYNKMFFVWHSGDLTAVPPPQGVTLIGPKRLSGMVLDAGLSSWLREKVS